MLGKTTGAGPMVPEEEEIMFGLVGQKGSLHLPYVGPIRIDSTGGVVVVDRPPSSHVGLFIYLFIYL